MKRYSTEVAIACFKRTEDIIWNVQRNGMTFEEATADIKRHALLPPELITLAIEEAKRYLDREVSK